MDFFPAEIIHFVRMTPSKVSRRLPFLAQALSRLFSGRAYGWSKEVQNLNHDIVEHMETDTSEENFPPWFLAKKIRQRRERIRSWHMLLGKKNEAKESRTEKSLGNKMLASLCTLDSPLSLAGFSAIFYINLSVFMFFKTSCSMKHCLKVPYLFFWGVLSPILGLW